MAVRMELSRILIREMTDMQLIELAEVEGERSFPIVIGLPEAFAIDRRLKGLEYPRPQTHDLLASSIRALHGRLREIHINDLSEGTFFALLVVDTKDGPIEIDARPSDAIALGIAEDVPIFVAEHVLENTQTVTLNDLAEHDLDDDDLPALLDDEEDDDVSDDDSAADGPDWD